MKNLKTSLIVPLFSAIILSTIVHVATWNYKHSKNDLAYVQNYENRDQKKSQSANHVKTENNTMTSNSDEGFSGEKLKVEKKFIKKKLRPIEGA